MDSIISEVNSLRSKYHNKIKSGNMQFISNLVEDLENNSKLKNLPCTINLVADLKNSLSNKKFALNHTRNYINLDAINNGGYVLSIFEVPYNKSMSFEMYKFREVEINEVLKNYETNGIPVVVEACSDGLINKDIIGTFPENHIDGTQNADEKIIFFIDKFAARHKYITTQILSSYVTLSSFTKIRELSDPQIQSAVVSWVWLHEYHHQNSGSLRLPEYLKLKSNKFIAGLEELRVDISSMLLCCKEKIFADDSEWMFEFILSERILRYGVDGVKINEKGTLSPSYDAIGCFLGFILLQRYNGISIIDNKIHVTNEIIVALEQILDIINNMEYKLKNLPESEIKANLLEFIIDVLGCDGLQRFSSLEFYNQIRARINLDINMGLTP